VKLCSFNCVYCQYGYTRVKQKDLKNPSLFPGAKDVLITVETAMPTISPSPSYVTFSGNGEAALHPDFEKIVHGITRLRDMYCPQTKTAILSNSSEVREERIRRILDMLDVRIMKLDCANEKTFRAYNQPCCDIKLEEIIEGLKSLRDVTIQTLFSGGKHGNTDPDHIEQWIDMIQYLSPIHLQIYTLDRGYPSKDIYPLDPEKLRSIKTRLTMVGISAEAY
jgi:wyosine [tRNA(Phe)-imidazoG37] synthetase (radical SAM superfamily)